MEDLYPVYMDIDGVRTKCTAYMDIDGIRTLISRAKQQVHNYLTFSSTEPFTISVYNSKKNWDGTLYYSTDVETWNEWDGTTAITSAEQDAEQRIYMRGTENSLITGSSPDYRFVITGKSVKCEGNIENLLDYETVTDGEHPVMSDFCYYALFAYCSALTSAPELPAITLTKNCYQAMFADCTSLVNAPKLTSKTLANICYKAMFYGCTALSTPPELPATELKNGCYSGMFRGCTSLTTLPKLPATILENGCYNVMFYGCTGIKLSSVKVNEYQSPYRIPDIRTGTALSTTSLEDMFANTGGTFTGTPEINTTYYTTNEIV